MRGACSVNQGSCARTPGVADNLGEAGPGTSPGARAGVPLTRGRAQAIPRREGASFVSFLPLQQKIGHPPGTRGIRGIPWCSPPPEGIPQARGGHNPSELQSEAGLGHSPGTGVGARCRHCEGVADTGVGCRHCEGVVDTVRGSSTPRGGYNARSCQQRASVPTTRAGVNNARRCGQRASVPITNVRAGGPRRRQVRRSRRPTGTATCLPQWVFSRSDAVGLTQEATAGRAMSTSMVALNGRPGTPGRLLTHGPRRARAQSHRGRQVA